MTGFEMGAIENVKEVAKLVKDLGNIDLYRHILDLQGDIMKLTHENRELKAKLEELEGKLSQVGQMKFRSPFYYAEGDEIPHCPRCWEMDKRAVHYPPPFLSGAGPVYTCPQCKRRIVHPRQSK
jgi:hypothetical protein